MRTKTAWLLLGILCLASFAVAQETAWEKYIKAGEEAYRRGQYVEAQKQFLAALKEAERFGNLDPRLATSLNDLAEVHRKQGQYAKAEPLFRRSLAMQENALGPEHPNVALSLNNLAALYYAQGEYAEAEPLLQRSLAIREKALGPQHPDVAQSLNNLAVLYLAQGEYGEAERLARRALAIQEKALGSEHRDVALSLNNLAELYRNQGKYGEAEPLHKRSLAIREKALGPDHPDVAQSLNNLALFYHDQGEYAKAEPLHRRTLAIMEKTLGLEHPDLATSLNNLAELYRVQEKYSEAEPLFLRSLAIREKTLRPEHPDVAQSLNNLAGLYKAQSKYADAEPLLRRALAIAEKTLGSEHPHVATGLNNLAGLYKAQGEYAEAEPLYKRSLAIREKALGPQHPDVAQSLNNLAVLYHDQGRYAETEPLYRRALAIQEKAVGPDHPSVATSLGNLAGLYHDLSMYAEAESLYRRSLAIREKALGPEHPSVAGSLNNLASLYHDQAKYAQAEPLYRRSLAIVEEALGPDYPHVATSLDNLATLYHDQGNYGEAETLYKRSLAIREKVLGPEHPSVAGSLNNVASLYDDQSNYAEAELLYKRALAIDEKTLGPEHPDVAIGLNNLAGLYTAQGQYVEAEPLYKRSLAIREKALGAGHTAVATSLNNMAELYRKQGQYAEAEPLFRRSLAIKEKVLRPEHPSVGLALENLAILHYAQDRPDEAESLFGRSLQNLAKQFEQHFAYMSEKERLLFLDKVSLSFPFYYSFCFSYWEKNPALVGRMYDVVLWQKGLVGTSIAALRAEIAAGGDKQALALLDEMGAKKTRLAALVTSEPRDRAQWRTRVEQLEREANELERELVRRSATLAEQKQLARLTWRDVQRALKEDEAAVEFVRFRFHDGKRATDKIYYVALIVTPESKAAPTLVLLGEAKQLEGPLVEYRARVQDSPTPAALARTGFYEAFWKPLEGALARTKRVYVSPDGVLNLISWAVVAARDGRLLLETYDLRTVSSTRDILRRKRSPANNSAVLIGHPRFDLDEARQRAATRALQKTEDPKLLLASVSSGLRSREQRGGKLGPLPSTKAEVQAIQSLLRERGWRVEVYTEEKALEEAVKGVQQPRVLHAATHGFFLPDQQRKLRNFGPQRPSGMENPMLRSGLYFAGANRVLAGNAPPAGLGDGVLTAYEATGLNLHGTELVVLSACKTGLGQVRNGEGVFGLRRALQVAGAEAVLMSLWSVPDRETQELMTLFYSKWLSGQNKHEAFREAQLELRAKVKERYEQDLPFYWGAFVLVGR